MQPFGVFALLWPYIKNLDKGKPSLPEYHAHILFWPITGHSGQDSAFCNTLIFKWQKIMRHNSKYVNKVYCKRKKKRVLFLLNKTRQTFWSTPKNDCKTRESPVTQLTINWNSNTVSFYIVYKATWTLLNVFRGRKERQPYSISLPSYRQRDIECMLGYFSFSLQTLLFLIVLFSWHPVHRAGSKVSYLFPSLTVLVILSVSL